MPQPLPKKLIVGLAVAIVLDTATQLLWKLGANQLPDGGTLWQMAEMALRQPLLMAVALLMAGSFLNWMLVLEHTDLSYAHAITALSYVTVAATSVAWLDEVVETTQAIGIGLILAGVFLVSRSGHSTNPPAPSMPVPEATP